MLDAAPAGETLLEVNNIEVIYNHVILVLKGVSLSVPKGGVTALLGGNLGQLAVRHGWTGVVVDGCVRDVEELTGLPIGIRALATTPMPPMKRQPGLIDVPVHIQGVPVLPGGWLYADADGIVISRTPLHPN